MHVCMHVCMHAWMDGWTDGREVACVVYRSFYTYLQLHTHVLIQIGPRMASLEALLGANVRACVCTHMFMYMYIYMYVCVYICI